MAIRYSHRCDVWTRALGADAEIDSAYGSVEEPDLSLGEVEPNFENLSCRFYELDSAEGERRLQNRDARVRCAALHLPASAKGKIGRFDRLRVNIDNDIWSVSKVIECRSARSGDLRHLECEIERTE